MDFIHTESFARNVGIMLNLTFLFTKSLFLPSTVSYLFYSSVWCVSWWIKHVHTQSHTITHNNKNLSKRFCNLNKFRGQCCWIVRQNNTTCHVKTPQAENWNTSCNEWDSKNVCWSFEDLATFSALSREFRGSTALSSLGTWCVRVCSCVWVRKAVMGHAVLVEREHSSFLFIIINLWDASYLLPYV